MAVTARITFHGTEGLVPTTDDSVMRVLLGRFNAVPNVAPQVAYVGFHKDNWHKDNKRQVNGPPADVKGRNAERRHVVLDGEFLSIDGAVADADAKLTVNRAKDSESDTPVAGDERSIFWLPHIDRITPGAGDIEPALLDVPLSPRVQPGLAARIDLRYGFLQTTGASKLQLRFSNVAGSSQLHAIARESELTVRFTENQFRIRSTPLVEGRKSTDGDMLFVGEDGALIDLVIGNEPAADIYQAAPPIDLDAAAKAAAAEFELYYQLSKQRPSDPLVPFIARRRPSGQLCANGVFNGSDGGRV